MRIRKHNDDRPRLGKTKNLSEARGDREISLSLWRQISQTAKSVCGDRQQGSEEWDIRQCCCAGLRKQSFQLSELYIGGVPLVQTSCMLKLIDYRVKWAVGVARRALIPDSDVRFVGDAIQPIFIDTGLADAGLTAKKRDLPFAVLGPLPEIRDLLQFMLSSDKLCKLPRSPGGESAFDRSFPSDQVRRQRLRKSVKFA